MSTLIHKDGQQFGPYSEADIEQFLRSGQLSPNDLAWREGMSNWQPLGSLLGGSVSVPAPPPPPLPSPASAGKAAPVKGKSKIGSVVMAIVIGLVVLGQLNNLTKSDRDQEGNGSGATSSEQASGDSSDAPSRSPDVELLSWHWELGSGSLGRVQGEVRNTSGEPIRSIEAIASFYDADQHFISSYKAMIQFSPLLPGQTSPFRITFPPNPAMATANLKFGVFLGKPLTTAYKDTASKPQGSHPVGVSGSGTQFTSMEEAGKYAVGTWTNADRPSRGLWTRWVVKENGSIEEYSAPATSDDWGKPTIRTYQMVTGKYEDTGERYYGLKTSAGYTAIIRLDGRLRMGLSDDYLVKGDRFPFSK